MKKIIVIASMAFAAFTAGATCPMDSLAAAIADANPSFKARCAELKAGSAAAQADGMLPGVEVDGEHLWGRGGDNRWGFGISQSFDWPGVYAAKRRARRAGDNAFSQLAASERVELTLEAKLALIDLVAARRNTAVIAEIYKNVTELTAFTQKALDHGQATILDLRKLQIEGLDMALRLEQAGQAQSEAVARLRAMGYDGDVPEDMDYPEASADYAAAESRWMSSPAVRASQSGAEAAAERASAAARSSLPGFSLGYRHQFEGGNHFNGVSVGIALPSWGVSRAKAAAKAEAEAARLQAEWQVAQTVAAFDDARRRLEGLSGRMKAYDEALSDADYVVLLRKSLDGGQISTLTYIQEINFFLEARLSRENTARDYHAALAVINKY